MTHDYVHMSVPEANRCLQFQGAWQVQDCGEGPSAKLSDEQTSAMCFTHRRQPRAPPWARAGTRTLTSLSDLFLSARN